MYLWNIIVVLKR